MRTFFISWAEKLVAVLMVLLIVGVCIGAAAVSVSGQPGAMLGALALLVLGALYVIIIGGVLYLGFGIYHNTRRTAEALGAQNAARSGL